MFQELFYIKKNKIKKLILWSNLRQKTKIPKNFIFYSLENVYIVHDHIVASFLFLLQKKFCITHKHIVAFWPFPFQKDFGTFREPLLKAFLCFFGYILLTFLYIRKNYKKNIWLVFSICVKTYALLNLYHDFYESIFNI